MRFDSMKCIDKSFRFVVVVFFCSNCDSSQFLVFRPIRTLSLSFFARFFPTYFPIVLSVILSLSPPFSHFILLRIIWPISLVFVCCLRPQRNRQRILFCFRRIPMLIVRQFYACNIIIIDFFYEIVVLLAHMLFLFVRSFVHRFFAAIF